MSDDALNVITSDLLLVQDACRDLPSPETWMMDHAKELHEEEQRNSVDSPTAAAQNERLVQIAKRIFERTP